MDTLSMQKINMLQLYIETLKCLLTPYDAINFYVVATRHISVLF